MGIEDDHAALVQRGLQRVGELRIGFVAAPALRIDDGGGGGNIRQWNRVRHEGRQIGHPGTHLGHHLQGRRRALNLASRVVHDDAVGGAIVAEGRHGRGVAGLLGINDIRAVLLPLVVQWRSPAGNDREGGCLAGGDQLVLRLRGDGRCDDRMDYDHGLSRDMAQGVGGCQNVRGVDRREDGQCGLPGDIPEARFDG